MKTYVLKRPLYGNGETKPVGHEVDLPDHEAAPLLASGAIEVKTEKPHADKMERKPANKAEKRAPKNKGA